jgi:hypothetical protein
MVAVWWRERHQSTEKCTTITFGNRSRPTMAARTPRADGSPPSASIRRRARNPTTITNRKSVEVRRGSQSQ